MVEEGYPLEKILTVSVRDYCDSVGKDLKDYNLVGVHVDDDLPICEKLIQAFRTKVPLEAEVVVGFQYSLGGAGGSSGFMLLFSGFGGGLLVKV